VNSLIISRSELLAAQQADTRGESATLAGGESGERVRERIDGAVDDIRVAAPGDVVESTAQRQVVPEKVKAFFGLQVQGEVERESFRAGRADEFLLGAEKAEGKSGTGFQRVGKFELVDDGELEER